MTSPQIFKKMFLDDVRLKEFIDIKFAQNW